MRGFRGLSFPGRAARFKSHKQVMASLQKTAPTNARRESETQFSDGMVRSQRGGADCRQTKTHVARWDVYCQHSLFIRRMSNSKTVQQNGGFGMRMLLQSNHSE